LPPSGTIPQMTYSIQCDTGDVVLVPFRFTTGIREKRRPVVIVSAPEYNAERADVVAVALTTQIDRSYIGDCLISDWQAAGLPQPSMAKGVLATIEKGNVERNLGSLTGDDMARLRDSLRRIMGL